MSLTAAMIDQREPSHILALQFGGVPVSPVMLDCGDLWASCADGSLLVVERKTPGDLLNSIKDGRLFQQCSAIRQRSVWAYLVVTGILADSMDGHVVVNGRSSGWRWPDVQGALLTVQDLGVSVVACQGDEAYEDTILRLARRERIAEKSLAPRTQGRVLTPAEQILTSLPGIGLERAQTLLTYWQGNPARALEWLTWLDTVLEIEGIGNGTKHQVRKALGLGPDEWLTVFTPEAAVYAAKAAADVHQERGAVVGVRAEGDVAQPQSGHGRGGEDGSEVSREISGIQMPILPEMARRS